MVSDCGAIGDIYLHHKFAPTAEAGVAKALQAGTDLNCGVEYEAILPAVKQGLIKEAEIDQSLRRLLLARFRLGIFDPKSMVKYAQIPYSVNDSPAHRQLALETARKAMVLLKNENHILPLSKSLKTIAVIGPNANDFDALTGNYNGDPTAPVTALAGIKAKLPAARVIYARGSDLATNMPNFEVVPASALFTSNVANRRAGLTGEYFNSSNFDGKAHRPRELTYPNSGKMVGEVPLAAEPLFTRVDPKIDFRWWDGAPRPDMHDDDFGVRWSGYLSAPVTGTYQLGAIGMNAFELYLDGKLLVDFNNIHERSYRYEQVKLEAGKLYQIRLDYHEFLNDADIQLVWSQPVDPAKLSREALDAARSADAVVLVLGLSPRLEGEEMKVPVEGFQGGDRVSLDIPRVQQQLLESVIAVGKPTVLVLMNGSAVSVNWAHDHVPAIVEAWYPGEAGGSALADVLFGDYNPAGRLPVTFYKSANQLPPFTDYNMKGRTYRYFQGEALFPFGFGLSYTTFAYRNLHVPTAANAGDEVKVAVEVENTGKVAGEEVVQLYIKATSGQAAPIRSLAGFERVALRAGERKTVQFALAPRQFSTVSADGRRIVAPGIYRVSVGGGQAGAAAATLQHRRRGQGVALTVKGKRPAKGATERPPNLESPAVLVAPAVSPASPDFLTASQGTPKKPMQGASSEVVRDINRRIVLNLIRTRQPISRADLARVSGLQRSTISLIVEQLIDSQWVREGATGRLPRGRRPTFLRLNDERVIIGVDLRPTQTTVALADANGKFSTQEVMVTPPDPKVAVPMIVESIKRIASTCHGKMIEGVGLSLPGRYNFTTERLAFAPNLKWQDVDLRTPIMSATGLEVELENAANACVLATVWFDRTETYRNMVVVTVSEGIGTGILANGQLVRGFDGMAGEFGHVALDPKGPPCGCGSRGCWEVYASNRAAQRYYFESGSHLQRAQLYGSAEPRRTRR